MLKHYIDTPVYQYGVWCMVYNITYIVSEHDKTLAHYKLIVFATMGNYFGHYISKPRSSQQREEL